MKEQEEQMIRNKILAAEQEGRITDFDPAHAWNKLENKMYGRKQRIRLLYWSAAALVLLFCVLPLCWQQTPEQPLARVKPPQAGHTAVAPAVNPTDTSTVQQALPQQQQLSSVQKKISQHAPEPIALPGPEAVPAKPAPAAKTQDLAATEQPVLKRAMPQVSLAELLDDEPDRCTLRQKEPVLHIGIRKTMKTLPEEAPGQAIAHHVLSIKL